MFEGYEEVLKQKSILALQTYCNLTGCAIEFNNGGTEILVIPPGCNK